MVMPALSSPPMRNFTFAQQRANVLEAYRSFVSLYAVQSRDGVNQMCSGNATLSAQLFATRFEQIIEHQAQDVIGLDERAVAIENAEAVGIAVGGKACERFLFQHQFFQRREILFRRVGAAAIEQHVALGANRFDRHSMIGEDAIEPAGAAAVHGVVGEIAFGFGQHIEANHFFQLREIRGARINSLEIVRDVVEMTFFVVRQCGGAFLDVFGDFGQSRAAIGAGKFQAVVFGGVVAGGDVDAAIEFVVNDGVGQDRSRRWFRAENDGAAIFRAARRQRCAQIPAKRNAYRGRLRLSDFSFARRRVRRWRRRHGALRQR